MRRVTSTAAWSVVIAQHDRPASPPSFGPRLRLLRQSRNLSLDQLADLAGVRKNTVYKTEKGHTGRPHPNTLKRYAAALGVTVEELLGIVPLHHAPNDAIRPPDSGHAEVSAIWNRLQAPTRRAALTTLRALADVQEEYTADRDESEDSEDSEETDAADYSKGDISEAMHRESQPDQEGT